MNALEEDMEKPQAILFDIDGTLISTGGAGARSWRAAFRELCDVEADRGQYTDGGMTDPDVGRLTFEKVMNREPSDDEMERLLAGYVRHLPAEVKASQGYKVMPGVEALLRKLSTQPLALGITTGGLEPAARIKLARADLNQFFSFGGFGSDSSDRTELTLRAMERASDLLGYTVEPANVLVVGDTPKDIAAAHGASAVGVGVATGKYSVQQLQECGAEYVLNTLDEPLPGISV
ncbi:MAG: HAD family hydrolase [Vulcanimicrobiaceae bacterium]